MIKQFVARGLLAEYANDPTAQILTTGEQAHKLSSIPPFVSEPKDAYRTIIDNPPPDIHTRIPGRWRMFAEECGGREGGLGKGWACIVCGHNGKALVPKPVRGKGHAGFIGEGLTEVYVSLERGTDWVITVTQYTIGPDDGRVSQDGWACRLFPGQRIEDKLPDKWIKYIPAILAAQSKAQCVECGKNGHKAHYTVYEAPMGKEARAI